MTVRIHPHALERIKERGTTVSEVITTVNEGKQFPAKQGRTGFQQNFFFGGEWQGKRYQTKQVIVYAVQEGGDWLVITVITRYFD